MVTSYGYYKINMHTFLLFEIYIIIMEHIAVYFKKSHFYIPEPDSLRQ